MEYTLKQKYQLIRNAVAESTGKNPVKIAQSVMKKNFVNIHGPEHHFLDGAAFLAAYRNAGGKIDLDAALDTLAERAAKMPGAICGQWGVCGAAASVGAALAVINGTGPLSETEFYKHNMEFTSDVIGQMSKIGGPRCCKRNAFLSLGHSIEFVKEKYGIEMEAEKIVCRFYPANKQCIGTDCPFYPDK